MSRNRCRGALAIVLLTVAFITPTEAAAADAHRPDAVRCATPQLREVLDQEIGLPPRPRGALPCDHTPVGPPPNPQVGDTWNWYTWRLGGMPVADFVPCTIRGMGPNCYVVVEDSQWNVNINQAQVDIIVERFENSSIGPYPGQGIWDLNTSHFGMPPDLLDQDPRIYILYYDLDINADGFSWYLDQYCDDDPYIAPFHSNECDMIYMNCSDYDPAGDYLLAVVAHEFEHLIHQNYDPNEVLWVDEGLAELAMWLYGNPDNVVSFNTYPDRDLTSFSGYFYDYVKVYLWTLYFYERYGGQPAIQALVQAPQNSIAGYEAVLDAFSYTENFTDVFQDWVVANYLDDTTIGDGRFGYVGETLPSFNPFVTQSSYPVGPLTASVQHWAADYARFINGTALHMTFDGSDNNLFAVRALLLDSVTPTEVVDLALDGLQAGTLPLPQLGATHDEVVMVYAGVSSAGAFTYQYGAGTGIVEAPEVAPADGLSLAVRGSVSDRPTFVLSIPAAGEASEVRLEVFDVSGRLVRNLLDVPGLSGQHEVVWDGRTDEGTSVAPGTYFARLVAGEERVTARATLRR